MPISTVTSKGQITIPADVRLKLGLTPGSRVEFFELGDGGYGFLPVAGAVSALRGMIQKNPRPVTVEEMDEAVAQGASERFSRA